MDFWDRLLGRDPTDISDVIPKEMGKKPDPNKGLFGNLSGQVAENAGTFHLTVRPDIACGQAQNDGRSPFILGFLDHFAQIPAETMDDLMFPRNLIVDFFGFFCEGFRALGRAAGRLSRVFRLERFFGGLLFRRGLLVRLLGLITLVFLRSRLAGFELLDLPGRKIRLRGLGIDLQEFFHGCNCGSGLVHLLEGVAHLEQRVRPFRPFRIFLDHLLVLEDGVLRESA